MISNDRQYRSFELRAKDLEKEEEKYIVEGYACVFEQDTVLYSFDGVDYKEIVDRKAFDGCQMNDVVMNYNHSGKPVARTKNGSLNLTIDDYGLKIKANLGLSEESRRLYEEITNGLIDKMSFAFTIKEDSYDNKEHTRRVLQIDRLFDVAAVDIPAYEQTSISARSLFDSEEEMARLLEKRNLQIENIKKLLED